MKCNLCGKEAVALVSSCFPSNSKHFYFNGEDGNDVFRLINLGEFEGEEKVESYFCIRHAREFISRECMLWKLGGKERGGAGCYDCVLCRERIEKFKENHELSKM